MASYDIDIYQTDTLYDELGDDSAANRVKDYLNGSFSYVNNHSVNPTVISDHPVMYEDDGSHSDNDGFQYEQKVLDSHSERIPCEQLIADYAGIGFYFQDWLPCFGHPLDDADIHVLLTAADSENGHTIHGPDYSICVAEGGRMMPDAPSSFTRYEPANNGTTSAQGIGAIQTVHHEVGHALVHDDEDVHTDHELGAVTDSTVNHHWVTPLGLNWGYSNECFESWVSRPGTRRWDLVWSDCCQGEWESPLG